MIESMQLLNFKNFRNATLRLGPLTVIVGTNASGKSNLRDAFRFVHGMSRGYSLAEIIGEKYVEGGGITVERNTGRHARDSIPRLERLRAGHEPCASQ